MDGDKYFAKDANKSKLVAMRFLDLLCMKLKELLLVQPHGVN